ncbi:MAG: sigma-70 family RNA polymerase sigma factor [Faecousia sp.]
MTNEELVSMIQGGEWDKLLELWEQVRRFVWRQAKRREFALDGAGGITSDDLVQAGYLALVRAVDHFDPTAGGTFLTYFGYWLKAAFNQAAGLHTKRNREDPLQSAISLDTPLTDDLGDPLTLADAISDPAAEVEMEDVDERDRQVRLHAALEAALAQLPEDQRKAIRDKYYRGQRVDSKAHAAALRALRQPSVSRALKVYI